jgi:hypothetical protein
MGGDARGPQGLSRPGRASGIGDGKAASCVWYAGRRIRVTPCDGISRGPALSRGGGAAVSRPASQCRMPATRAARAHTSPQAQGAAGRSRGPLESLPPRSPDGRPATRSRALGDDSGAAAFPGGGSRTGRRKDEPPGCARRPAAPSPRCRAAHRRASRRTDACGGDTSHHASRFSNRLSCRGKLVRPKRHARP